MSNSVNAYGYLSDKVLSWMTVGSMLAAVDMTQSSIKQLYVKLS